MIETASRLASVNCSCLLQVTPDWRYMLLASFIDATGSLSCRCFADMGTVQLIHYTLFSSFSLMSTFICVHVAGIAFVVAWTQSSYLCFWNLVVTFRAIAAWLSCIGSAGLECREKRDFLRLAVDPKGHTQETHTR